MLIGPDVDFQQPHRKFLETISVKFKYAPCTLIVICVMYSHCTTLRKIAVTQNTQDPCHGHGTCPPCPDPSACVVCSVCVSADYSVIVAQHEGRADCISEGAELLIPVHQLEQGEHTLA